MMRPWLRAAFLSVVSAVAAGAAPSADTVIRDEAFKLEEGAEVIASITASCDGCDWGRLGHEAAVLRLEVDGKYSQHLFLTRGASASEYKVMLGPLPAGKHSLTLARDTGAWLKAPKSVEISRVTLTAVPAASPERAAVELAPILYARPNTVGRFTDVPLLMWYEIDRTERGSRIRYSVIFSNEDGGTPADRLLATWGRLTDIEYVYGIEFDGAGRVIEETFQGKDHEIVPFKGRREGRHPLLYVVTDNNMVKDAGTTEQRFAPAPVAFDLTDASREKVMDENPWTYAVTAQEARRERRVAASPRPGSKRIFDPSRYAVVELCTASDDTTFATFTFSLGVSGGGRARRFFDSTYGVKEFRISRSPDNFPNSCFRGSVALPLGTTAAEIVSLQVRAHARPPRKDEAPPQNPPGPAYLRRVNKVFLMSASDLPEPSLFSWAGSAALPLDGAPVTLEIGPKRTTQK
ncbi:MAG TPA: hypothetical protein PKU70_06470 [Vicinamibacteria bacterium]|mgnify:CR=1 FL=1|nr:hypothetical protein [Vicinamibacteria bacterium]